MTCETALCSQINLLLNLTNPNNGSHSNSNNNSNDVDLSYLHEELLAVDTISKWLLAVSVGISIIANSFVIFCNLKSQNLNPYRYLILNLAICDLVYTSMQIFQAHRRFNFHVWVFGQFLCRAMSLSPISLTTAMFTMTFMAIERFITIVYPFRPRLTKRVVFLVVLTLWLAAALVHLPLLLNKNVIKTPYGDRCVITWPLDDDTTRKSYYLVSFMLTYPIPLGIIATSSINIIYTALTRMSRKRPSFRMHLGGGARANHVSPLAKYKKLFIMFTCIIVSFIATTTPNQALILWINFAPKEHLSFREARFTFFMLHLFAPLIHVHTIMNPLIYSFSDEKFRAELRQIVTATWRNVMPQRKERWLVTNEARLGGPESNQYESPSLIHVSSKSPPDEPGKDPIMRQAGLSEERHGLTMALTATIYGT